MTNPYRAMCAELLQELCCHYRSWELKEGHCSDAMNRARVLLAQPVAEEPTDEELEDLADVMNVSGDTVPAMRRALELWGRPTPQPVAVNERLPGAGDCDEQGQCWMSTTATDPGWVLDYPERCINWTHWLPANALPTPEATNG